MYMKFGNPHHSVLRCPTAIELDSSDQSGKQDSNLRSCDSSTENSCPTSSSLTMFGIISGANNNA
jgi:hypothetical protein